MIWHIFKKDLKLLWIFGLGTALIQFAIVGVHLKLGVFEEQEIFASLLLLLESMMYFGVAVLIAALVHQDSLVGIRQDWLVRPVHRRHLIAAKLLFLLLAVQLPMLLAGLAGGLANGFPLGQSLTAAVSQNLYFLIGFTLPIFAFVSLTRNITEALAAAFVIAIGVVGAEAIVVAFSGSPLGPTTNTGISWIPQTWRLAIYLAAAIVILALQYLRRATRVSRLVLGVAVVLCLLTQVVPWSAAYGWQITMAGAPPFFRSIAVHYNPDPVRSQSSAPASTAAAGATFAPVRRHQAEEGATVYIPIQFSGIPAGSILKIDRAIARVRRPGQRRWQLISPLADPGSFEVPNHRQATSTPLPFQEPLRVRGNLYNQLKNTPVTLQVNYSMTLLRRSSATVLPAVRGNLRTTYAGHCETRLNDSRTAVEVRCLDIGNPSQCSTFLLQDPATGLHNPPVHGCRDDYAPYFGRYKPPDTIMHIGANLLFRDPTDLVHYPVDAARLAQSQVLIRTYAVVGHFTSSLTIPGARLGGWSTP